MFFRQTQEGRNSSLIHRECHVVWMNSSWTQILWGRGVCSPRSLAAKKRWLMFKAHPVFQQMVWPKRVPSTGHYTVWCGNSNVSNGLPGANRVEWNDRWEHTGRGSAAFPAQAPAVWMQQVRGHALQATHTHTNTQNPWCWTPFHSPISLSKPPPTSLSVPNTSDSAWRG